MSIIGVQISAATHAAAHPERDPACFMCDLRAGDHEAALAKFENQQRAARRRPGWAEPPRPVNAIAAGSGPQHRGVR